MHTWLRCLASTFFPQAEWRRALPGSGVSESELVLGAEAGSSTLAEAGVYATRSRICTRCEHTRRGA